MHYLILGLGYILLHLGVGWLLRDYPVARAVAGNAGLVLSSLLVTAVVAKRRHEWHGCQQLFWSIIGIGMVLWTVGHLGWVYDAFIRHQTSWLDWHTVFSLCGGIAPLVGLLAFPHRGSRSNAAAATAVDLGGYGLLVIFIYAYFVMVPSMVPGEEPQAQRQLLLLVLVNRSLLLAGLLTAAWFARRTAWGRTYAQFAIGVAIGFAVRMLTNAAITRGDYQIGGVNDLAWIVPWLCFAWAAAEAPASSEPADALAEPPPAVLAVVPALLIPAVGYGYVYFKEIVTPVDSFRGLLTGVTTLVGLGLLALRIAIQTGALHRVDERLKLLAAATEQTGDLILITRADGDLEHANEAFVRTLGYSRSELTRLRLGQLLAERGVELEREIPDTVRERGVWRGTLLRRRRDGAVFPAACTVVALRDSGSRITHFVGVERDITDELKLRDQLVHSERLSAVGELVAGVAHEINNPLQTIVGCVELMLDDRMAGEISRRDLELVRREAGRAGHIVRNLLAFVRRSAPDRVLADLSQIVRTTVELREYHLQQLNIHLDLHLPDGPLAVLANREELQQVVLNLLLNAEHAVAPVPGGGRISISVRANGPTHVVEVSDNGPGISAELRGRVFEPFFTTKDVGEGTGLGLSISHGIASAHGGTLELCCTVGQPGACFRLTLPAHDQPLPRHKVEPPAAAAGRRVLVVDDEAPIRKLLARLLERRGFEVREADSGTAALAIAAEFRPTLLLCDVRMPGISGFDLYREAVQLDPAMASRSVFITGDDTSAEHESAEFAHVPILAKPFTAADLDAILAQVAPVEVH